MDTIPQHIIDILRNNALQSLTTSEKAELDLWLQQDERHYQLLLMLNDKTSLNADLTKLGDYQWQQPYAALKMKLQDNSSFNRTKTRPLRYYWLAASIILLIGVALGLQYFSNKYQPIPSKNIIPAINQAKIVLGNGRLLQVNTHSNENFVDTTSLLKLIQSGTKSKGDLSFTVSTPKGGKYAFELPEGTKIWMNANSQIKYQQSDTQRIVLLTGEAYFEVSKLAYKNQTGVRLRKPFIVKTAQMDVVVLGTHFDVSAYPKTAETATLIEGKVQVATPKQKMILNPGQRVVLSNGRLHKELVDKSSGTDLKNADFVFRNEMLSSIMSDLANWYNVSVVYLNENIKNEKFEGLLSRKNSLKDVINLLESTNKVDFKFKGRTIYVDSASHSNSNIQ